MANTVNDVMNVIASPDYGIKNIAGTTHEILAIMQGTHNSQNNIHSIVDDVRNLLQTLVIATVEKKPVEVEVNSTKINQKHIQDILDETKGIRKAIDNLTKSITKQGGSGYNVGVAKLSDKASQKVADAMVKSMKKQNEGGGMSGLIDAFRKLKDISLKDIIIGKMKFKRISELFKDAKKDLKIKDKDLNSIVKLINAAPEMIKSLRKIGWGINRIIKNETIKKLGEILVGENSLLSISKILQKNKKTFNNASIVAKDVKELMSHLNKAMIKLLFASLWAKIASMGIKSLEFMIDNFATLAKKLTKSKNDIDKGTKVAKNITILVGNLLVTSIFLTIAVVTGIPAMLGALILSKMIELIIPAVKHLSKNNKHIGKSISSALLLTAVTGLMALTSLFLASIAVTGIPAIIGSIFMLGIITVNIFAFKMLSKALKNIITGSIGMIIMSVSLLLFGIALKKIVDATKGVTFKQIGIIATLTVLLAGSVMLLGIPALFPYILLGSVAMAIMGFALMPFAKTLAIIAESTKKLKMKHLLLTAGSMMTLGLGVAAMGALIIPISLGSVALTELSLALRPFLKTLSKISSATKKLKMKNILLVTGSMMTLGLGVAAMAILTIPITLGSAALGAMGLTLYQFVKSLKLISDMGTIPTEQIHQVINVMQIVGNFFTKSALKRKAIKKARLYSELMLPFRSAVYNLSTLKKIGSIPMKLVYQTLNAMGAIANHYTNNPIEKEVIKQARKYKRMLKPFGNTLKHLAKLKDMGSVPMKLIYQVLDAMNTIGNYYVINPIEKEVIKQARKYKRMMRPFGKTLEHLSKLKEMGSIPMNLVYQTLNAMSTIANYYIDNPIKKKVIKNARKYKRMLKPFGKTIGYLSKLKEMGSIPIKLVLQTLNAMSTIANYYMDNPIEKQAIKNARKYKRMLKPFGKAIEHLAKLKEMGSIPTNAVKSTILALSYISGFYNNIQISEEIEEKSVFSEYIVDKFIEMTKKIQDKFSDIKTIDYMSVVSIVTACRSIINYYKNTRFLTSTKKIDRMNNAVKLFTENIEQIKEKLNGFTENDYNSVKFAVISMKKILKLLKSDTLNKRQREKALENITVLKDMASTMSNISNMDPLKISDIGDALTTTLDGVKSIDMDQVEAVTNMFDTFNGINKSKNIINKFTDSVKEFTTACVNLIDAMNYNTDAISNIDGIGIDGSSTNIINENSVVEMGSDNNTNQKGGIRISNVDELAKALAEKINGILSVDIPDTQVQLLINGSGGNEWIISRY